MLWPTFLLDWPFMRFLSGSRRAVWAEACPRQPSLREWGAVYATHFQVFFAEGLEAQRGRIQARTRNDPPGRDGRFGFPNLGLGQISGVRSHCVELPRRPSTIEVQSCPIQSTNTGSN